MDLYYKDRALMTWTLVKGHIGPVKGLRASGPQGPDPYSYSYSMQTPQSETLLAHSHNSRSQEILVTLVSTLITVASVTTAS
jgi:hypothetical protein